MLIAALLLSLSSDRACLREYQDLVEYQGQAYGVITRMGVEYGGPHDHNALVDLRADLDTSVAFIVEDFRRDMDVMTVQECRVLRNAGQRRINTILKRSRAR